MCRQGLTTEHRQHTFKQFQSHVFDDELVPFAAVAGRLALPVGDVELGESAREVHHCDGDDLRLPLQTQRRAQANIIQDQCANYYRTLLAWQPLTGSPFMPSSPIIKYPRRTTVTATFRA